MAPSDRSRLVPKTVRDVRGRLTTVYVSPEEAPGFGGSFSVVAGQPPAPAAAAAPHGWEEIGFGDTAVLRNPQTDRFEAATVVDVRRDAEGRTSSYSAALRTPSAARAERTVAAASQHLAAFDGNEEAEVRAAQLNAPAAGAWALYGEGDPVPVISRDAPTGDGWRPAVQGDILAYEQHHDAEFDREAEGWSASPAIWSHVKAWRPESDAERRIVVRTPQGDLRVSAAEDWSVARTEVVQDRSSELRYFARADLLAEVQQQVRLAGAQRHWR